MGTSRTFTNVWRRSQGMGTVTSPEGEHTVVLDNRMNPSAKIGKLVLKKGGFLQLAESQATADSRIICFPRAGE